MLSDKGIRLITVVTYWIAILLGPLVPWASLILTDVAVRHVPLAQALHDFRAHLFAPGYNLFLIGMLNTVPFIAFALLALFHLGMSSFGRFRADAPPVRRDCRCRPGNHRREHLDPCDHPVTSGRARSHRISLPSGGTLGPASRGLCRGTADRNPAGPGEHPRELDTRTSPSIMISVAQLPRPGKELIADSI